MADDYGILIFEGEPQGGNPPGFLRQETVSAVSMFHKTVVGYERTPLVSLNSLSKKLGIGGIFVKDESYRFGLNAFKGLGGIYAVGKIISKQLGMDDEPMDFERLTSPEIKAKIKDMVFITATDGNHGRGIAWAASKFGCRAVVYMPKGSKEHRVNAIRNINNTKVTVTDYNYDDTVRFAAKCADENHWFLVQDTGWEGYEEVPQWITQGYITMATEALEQLKSARIEKPTHVFLQAGVGSMAAGILGYLANYYGGRQPITTIVEPDTVACFFESAKASDGQPHGIPGNPVTIMAGLNCGQPSTLAWPIIRDFAKYYASCPDYVSARGMRILGNPIGDDQRVISGESGAVGLGLLTMLMEKKELKTYRDAMGLDEKSVVLIINTEGNTDPAGYQEIVHDGKMPTPYSNENRA